MGEYRGAWPAMVTPYDDALRIDRGAYAALVDWYIAHGVGGLYANCLTSEMYLQDDAERLLLVRDAVTTAAGRVPVAATGNLGDRIEAHIALCRRVADAGADVVMLVIPEFHEDDADLERYSQSDLKQLYENKHRLRLGEYDWVTSLILMALPFSREFLTVVLPGDCRIQPIVHERARKCGVRITTAPLNLFPDALVARLAACHLVPAISNEPETEYPEFLEKAIGESPKQNRELVPRAWMEFGAAG